LFGSWLFQCQLKKPLLFRIIVIIPRHQHILLCIAYVAAVSFPFPGGEIEQASEQVGERKSVPWVSNKLERSGEGISKKG